MLIAGFDVVDLGAVTTPMLYYVAATRGRRGCHSGIMVTGSHNPKDYNGFKMVLAGRAIYGDDIQALRQLIESEGGVKATGGSVRQVVEFLFPMYDLEAWDFSPNRGSLGLFRSLTRYAPDRGRRFPDMETMITAAATPPARPGRRPA